MSGLYIIIHHILSLLLIVAEKRNAVVPLLDLHVFVVGEKSSSKLHRVQHPIATASVVW
jgi:hypothetical protein